MKKKLNCEQVTALINFYAEGCLSELLAKHVKKHLENCPNCMNNYRRIIDIMNKYNNEQNEVQNDIVLNDNYKTFLSNLSAYIDNELDDFENIKIKKFAIINPLARQKLENIYNYKKILKETFEKTKNNFKHDFSKDIICKLKSNHSTCNFSCNFSTLLLIMMAGIFAIFIGAFKFLYF